MLDAQPKQENGAKELDALLAEAILSEKRSRKRAVIYTIVPVVVGLIFLGTSLYTASRLEQRATNLRGEIEGKTKELNQKADEAKSLETKAKDFEAQAVEAERNLTKARSALIEIGKGGVNPQKKAREALREVSSRPDEKSSPPSGDVRLYDGNMSLSDLRNTIRIDEYLGRRLVSLVATNSNGMAVNKASYTPVESSWYPGNLVLIEISRGSDLAEAEARGAKKIFETTVYVEGKKTRIAVFRLR